MRRPTLACALTLAVCLAVLVPLEPAKGCGTAKRKDDPPVLIATEAALIVWDAKKKKQHFIRRASFETKAPYFGFLVPTPTKPDDPLTEVSDELFTSLEDWTKPKTRKEYGFEDPPEGGCGGEKKDKAPAVEVLAKGSVAGLEYSMLKASDPKDLGAWLKKHEYDWTPAEEKWIAPYVQKGWVVTAFQNKKDKASDPHLSMKAVRMSFTTDEPFFPYREPTEAGWKADRPDRLLRIYLVADKRMEAKLSMANPLTGKTFTGSNKRRKSGTAWANPLTGEQSREIANNLGGGVSLEDGAWLTVIDDYSEVRQDADLYFSPSDDQSTLERDPIVKKVELPFFVQCLCCCFTLVGGPMLLLLWIVLRWLRHTGRGK
jgi:hypothetical protein